MSATSSPLRASQATILLVVALVLLLVILVGGSTITAIHLMKKSTVATHAQIDAEVSNALPGEMLKLKTYLAENTATVQQTNALAAGLGAYTKDSITTTLNGYASKAGLPAPGLNFGPAAAPGTVATAAGETIGITYETGISYQKFIVFLQMLETGIMPAQVTSARVAPDSAKGSVIVTSFEIKVAQ